MASPLPAFFARACLDSRVRALATADSAHVKLPTKGMLGTPRLLPKAPELQTGFTLNRRLRMASSLPARRFQWVVRYKDRGPRRCSTGLTSGSTPRWVLGTPEAPSQAPELGTGLSLRSKASGGFLPACLWCLLILGQQSQAGSIDIPPLLCPPPLSDLVVSLVVMW